jgi:ATP phosphoribosyltransferase
MRGDRPEVITQKIFNETQFGGLQGPTISPIGVRDGSPNWYSVSIVVRRDLLPQAISQLRLIGGSGIIVTPLTYIFEEEPPRYKAMLKAIE